MKIIPLTFFLLIFVLLSCDNNKTLKENNKNLEEITLLLEKANSTEIPFQEKEIFLDKAVNLSKKTGNDSLWLQALSLKVYYSSIYYPEKTSQFISELEEKASEKNIAKYKGYVHLMKGNLYKKQSKYDSAYTYLRESNIYYNQTKDSLKIGYNLIKMAKIHLYYDDYSSAEELTTDALKFLKNTNSKDYILEAYNILGHVYLNAKDYKQAIDFYNKSLELVNNQKAQIVIKNNIASTYIYSKEYQKALDILTELLYRINSSEYSSEKALVLYNIGCAKFNLDKNDGLQELKNSLDIRIYTNNDIATVENYIKLAEFYKDKNKELTKEYASEAYKKAEKYKNIDNSLTALKILIQVSDKDKLQNYSESYISLNDSITEVRLKAKNQFAKLRYDYSNELNQNLLLKNKSINDDFVIEKQKNRTQLLVSTFVLLLVLILIFYQFIRIKHKKEKVEEIIKTENRISVKIHDELANDIYNAIAFTESFDLSEEKNKNKLLDNLEDVYIRTRNISKENNIIETGNEYINVLKNMLSEYHKTNLKIMVAGIENINWIEISSQQKTVIYRVLQELMVNMSKHSQANLVVIKFNRNVKKLEIDYSDNGIGISSEKIFYRNGLQNVETRTKNINGTITFDTTKEKGLKIKLVFPL